MMAGMRLRPLALATVLVSSLAACSSQDDPKVADKSSAIATPTPSRSQQPRDMRPTPTVTPVGAPRLEGNWKVTALIGRDGTSALTGRYRDDVRMKFKAGSLTATNGCNGVFTGYQQSGPGGRDLIFVGETGSTSVYCGVDDIDLMTVISDVRHAGEANGIVYLLTEKGATVAVLKKSKLTRPYWP